MKHILRPLVIVSLLIPMLFGQIVTTFAQDASQGEAISIAPAELAATRAIITSQREVEVGRNLIFDASKSKLTGNEVATYAWDFGDGNSDTGKEAVHIYDIPGTYTVTLTLSIGQQTFTTTQNIFAYTKVVTFFYNGEKSTLESNLPSLEILAQKAGIFLNVIAGTEDNPLLTEEAITSALLSKSQVLENSTVIIGGPQGSSFLSAISKVATEKNIEKNPFEKKIVVVSTRDPLWLFKRIAQRLVGLISPEELILMQNDPFSTLSFILLSETPETFLEKVPSEDYTILHTESSESPFLLLSYLITIAITNGIPTQVITFVLFLPVILTIVGFFKLFIGAETIGLFQLLVLTLSFFILGITMGTLVLVLSIAVGVLMRFFLQKTPMLFVSKMTLLLSTSRLMVLLLLIFGSEVGLFFGIDNSNTQRALLSIFPMILIAMQADKFSQLSWPISLSKTAFVRLLTSYVAVVVAYFIIKWPALETMLLAIPELIILTYILQIFIGRYRGLRVVEYMRFRELFKHDIEE